MNEWMYVTFEYNRNTSNAVWWIHCRQACMSERAVLQIAWNCIAFFYTQR
jgi:hypothetical protein